MTDPMRLLVVTSDLVGRGAERELVALLSRLPRERFDVNLCLWRAVFDYSPPPYIPVTILGKHRIWDVGKVLWKTARLVDEWKPDLVFSQLNYVNTVTGTALRDTRHQPNWIPRFAGNPEMEIRFPVLPWTRWALGRADCVAGCSASVQESIARHLRVPMDKTCELLNVVDVDRILCLADSPSPINKEEGTVVFVNAGRLVPQKNQGMLIEALAELEDPCARLWILGEGPLRETLMKKAKQLGVADQIRWLGFQKDPYSIFKMADCFVLSSHYEGLPNVLIESMICGTPAISTDCPYGPADLIDEGVTGFLVPTDDTKAMSAAMKRFLDDPPIAKGLGSAAAEHAIERFRPERIVAMYADLFEQVVDHRPAVGVR